MWSVASKIGFGAGGDQRRANVPTSQIELDYGNEALDRVIYFGNMEEHLGVAHETIGESVSPNTSRYGDGRKHFVILSSMLRGSRINVGRTTRLRSAPGRSWEMIWERTGRRLRWSAESWRRLGGGGCECDSGGFGGSGSHSPLPWSGSMTEVSSSPSGPRGSSVEERAPAGWANQFVNMTT